MPSKIKISISVTFFAVLIASLVYQYKEIPVNQIRQTISHEGTGIETDSLKRLETLSKSGSNWGMSPFGSGKPLTEEEKELEATSKHPNTEWPTRTISGVTYVFGEGNPKEVAIPKEGMNDYWKNGGKAYMNPVAEKIMQSIIEDESKNLIFEQCVSVLDAGNYDKNIGWRPFETELHMADILYIDSETGRKEFDLKNIAWIRDMINQLQNPIDNNGTEFLWQKCLSERQFYDSFSPLMRKLLELDANYGSQWYTN